MEHHPHLHLFDANRQWRYLIVGTFPPDRSVRDSEKLYIDYFYGNKGFLWKIIHDIYHPLGYDFFGGSKEENLAAIQQWQNDYCVGLSDTICACSRKHPLSADDADLLDIQYNFSLRDYLLQERSAIRKIIFTSSYGKNSAFENFRIIMRDHLEKVRDKLVTGLPSPSGSANITFFNTNNEATLGLTDDFYQYVARFRPELISEFAARWALKKKKRSDKDLVIPPSPKGLVKEYKLWRYKQVLPDQRCT